MLIFIIRHIFTSLCDLCT